MCVLRGSNIHISFCKCMCVNWAYVICSFCRPFCNCGTAWACQQRAAPSYRRPQQLSCQLQIIWGNTIVLCSRPFCAWWANVSHLFQIWLCMQWAHLGLVHGFHGLPWANSNLSARGSKFIMWANVRSCQTAIMLASNNVGPYDSLVCHLICTWWANSSQIGPSEACHQQHQVVGQSHAIGSTASHWFWGHSEVTSSMHFDGCWANSTQLLMPC